MATQILAAANTQQTSGEFTLTEQKGIWLKSGGALHPEAKIVIEAKNSAGGWDIVETLHYGRHSGVLAAGVYRATRLGGNAVVGLEHAR